MLVQCKHQNENQVAADPDAGKYEQPGPMIMEVMIFLIFYLSSTLRNNRSYKRQNLFSFGLPL